MKLNEQLFSAFPNLETPRLNLRQIQVTDAQAILDMRQNENVNRYIARDPMLSISEANELVDKTNELFTKMEAIGWAGVHKGSGEMIGTCGIIRIDHHHLRAEIGGEMSAHYWGKKLALEASEKIVEFGFDQLQLHALESWMFAENRGAIAIMKALGFEKEAHLKDKVLYGGRFRDVVIYTKFR